MTELQGAIAERDRILTAMDVDAAQAFIAKHGGFVPKQAIDWTRVLHLARFEVTTMPTRLSQDSHIWLAKNGAQSITELSPSSPYLRAALDLIFPKDLTDAQIAELRG